MEQGEGGGSDVGGEGGPLETEVHLEFPFNEDGCETINRCRIALFKKY